MFVQPWAGAGNLKRRGVTLRGLMFRAVYRQIVRFLDWVNRSGSGSSASQATREAADYRRDEQIRSGTTGGGPDPR
jgi:hypothetical protein